MRHGDLILGTRLGLPICLSFFVFGIAYGVAAAELGHTPFQVAITSIFVFSGSTQFMLLDMNRQGSGLLSVALAVFFLNIRHVIMGIALLAEERGRGLGLRTASLLLMIDETWAIAMSPTAAGHNRLLVLIGAGAGAMAGWAGGSAAGAALGTIVVAPEAVGMDFVYFSVFLFILTSIFRADKSLVPLVVAVGVAWLTREMVDGVWYVLAGGIVGALAGGILTLREREENGRDI